jgi:micrococcal nuclease
VVQIVVLLVAMLVSGCSSSAATPTAPAPAPQGAGETAPQGADCPATYPIKGDISSATGDRIYHVPGSQSYAVTQPEACFATPTDAEAAGFRASGR